MMHYDEIDQYVDRWFREHDEPAMHIQMDEQAEDDNAGLSVTLVTWLLALVGVTL